MRHESLSELLQTWSGGRPLLILSFFFWRAGTSDQKSLSGLLRAILFQIASSEPSISSRLLQSGRPPLWTPKQLKDALALVLSSTQHLKYCLVVDGLDEFEGSVDQQRELVECVQNFTLYGNAKVSIAF